MEYTQEMTLDVNSNTAYTVVGAKQGDSSSRIIVVHITKNGVPYIIEPNTTAYFRFKKPDGKAILNEAYINYTDNTVSVILTSQTLAAYGRGYADVVLYGSNQEILSTVSFVLLIMATPNITEAAVSSDEFGYLQAIVDSANATIYQSEAWAVGTRSGIPVVGDYFNYQIIGSNTFTCTIVEDTFREKVGIDPGGTNQYIIKCEAVTYDEQGHNIYMWSIDGTNGLHDPNIDLDEYGITIEGFANVSNIIQVDVTDPDLQYQNNAKYWAHETVNAKDSIDNLDISTTILPSDAESSVDKTQIEDVNVTRSSTVLGTVTVDKDTFIAAVGEYGTYDFKYNGTSWVIDATIVTLDTYGITYTGTAIDGNSIEVVYSYHKHFNFNIPRGLTGDVNFMTFEIKPEDGYLYMYRPDHGTEGVSFAIVAYGPNEGCLSVKIEMGED